MSEKTWHVIVTRPRCERKVADLLSAQRIENFCAVSRKSNSWTGRKKSVLEPVFSNHVFVYITRAQQLLVQRTSGVLHFLYWLAQPAAVALKEIEAMRFLSGENNMVHFGKIEAMITRRLRNIQGDFLTWTANVNELNKMEATVQLPTLGFRVTAEVFIQRAEVVKFITSNGEPVGQADVRPVETNTAS